MKLYFAHQKSIYNTPKEYVLEYLIVKGFHKSGVTILNPNKPIHQENCKTQGGMDYFIKLVDECDGLVYHPFEDDKIGAGVGKEIIRALETNKPVYKIDPVTFNFSQIHVAPEILSVEETRERLKLFASSAKM